MFSRSWLRSLESASRAPLPRRRRHRPRRRQPAGARLSLEWLEDRLAPAAPIRAVWVDTPQVTDYVTEPNLRQNLVAQCAAAGINTIYLSVYQSTANSSGQLMYDASDLAALISLAHAQGIQVWADYGAPDWPALYAASGADSFPMQRLADVAAYNAANPRPHSTASCSMWSTTPATMPPATNRKTPS